MSSPNALRELTLARIRSFVREPEALFWTFGFPIMMAVGLGLAFRERPAEKAAVGIERGSVGDGDCGPGMDQRGEGGGDPSFDRQRARATTFVLPADGQAE